jgi:hypothetical protein
MKLFAAFHLPLAGFPLLNNLSFQDRFYLQRWQIARCVDCSNLRFCSNQPTLPTRGKSVTPKSNALRKGGTDDAARNEFLSLKNPRNEQKQ